MRKEKDTALLGTTKDEKLKKNEELPSTHTKSLMVTLAGKYQISTG